MCGALEELVNEGVQRGRQEGRIEGLQEGILKGQLEESMPIFVLAKRLRSANQTQSRTLRKNFHCQRTGQGDYVEKYW
ncbi:MAG: hypothetical protein ACLTML_13175 [Blautia faecis]